jgi:phosphoglycolate phosphatase
LKFNNKELIIFDLDGTLIDSVPDLAVAVNFMLESLKRDVFDENTIRFWVGNGAQVLVRRALLGSSEIDKELDEDLYNKALEIFLNYYKKHLCVHTQTYKNVPQTLHSLKTKGYRLAIVTNKPIDFVAPILNGLHLNDLFELTIGGDSLTKKKPDPLPLHYVCEKLNVSVEDALMVGDSKNDILAANAAKMQSIGVSYGYNYGENIDFYNPDEVVDDFADILKFFN